MELKELLEFVPLVGEIGKPLMGQVADVLDSEEFRRVMDVATEMSARQYHQLINRGVPAEHAILLAVSTKVALADIANKQKK